MTGLFFYASRKENIALGQEIMIAAQKKFSYPD